MIAPKQRKWGDKLDYVVVKRDGDNEAEQQEYLNATPTPTVDQILSGSYTRRQLPSVTNTDDDSDDEDDFPKPSAAATPSFGGPPPVCATRAGI